MSISVDGFILFYLAAGLISESTAAPPGGAVPLSDKEVDKHPKHRPDHKHNRVVIPPVFDARVAWPNCTSIGHIRDQGQCRTCWAVGAASVLTDRICIASNQTINPLISAHQAAACTYPSQSADSNCQAGGNAAHAYKHAVLYGLPTGGELKSHVGCIPYTVEPYGTAPLTCSPKCTNKKYPVPMDKDEIVVDGYWINHIKADYEMSQREIDAAVSQIQRDVMLNGPLTVTIDLYSDLATWNASQGVYRKPKPSADYENGHIVTIIGWNKTEDDGPYWLVRNSWGVYYGEKGIFWIAMGRNAVSIESYISAPVIKLENHCNIISFCDAEIDQAISMNVKDPSAPVYLFQGNCTLQVVVGSDGGLTPVGASVPLSRQFPDAPSGPITSYRVLANNNNKLWLLNPDASAAVDCFIPANSTKVQCAERGTGYAITRALAHYYKSDILERWAFYPAYPNWIYNFDGDSFHIGNSFSTFASVNALLDVDGTKMVVFGKNKDGEPVAGVLDYPAKPASTFKWSILPGPTRNILKCELEKPNSSA